MFRPTNPPIHQKNTHHWVGNSPQIPNLQTESKYLNSFKSYRVFTDLGGTPHTHAHTQAHARAHTQAHAHACMLNMINMAASMRVCTCVCTCLWTPPMPPSAPQPICPLPRAAGSPNHQKFISPKLIEIIRFCLKNLYL